MEAGAEFTQLEEAALDIPRRVAFQAAVQADLLPYVTGLPTFAGAWFDQLNGGELVVMLTEFDDAIRGEIDARVPKDAAGVRVVQAKYPDRKLRAAAQAAWAEWSRLGAVPELLGVAVDTRPNRIIVKVGGADLEWAQTLIPELERRLGVAVGAAVTVRPIDTTCQNRDRCEYPLMPGIRIAKGDTTINDCTMGFHVYRNWPNDVEFVTAGHCGYVGSNSWYHEGYQGPNGRRVGIETATLLGQNGFDIMRVSLEENQQTALVYHDWIRANAWLDDDGVVVGMIVKASRGHSNVISTGTVEFAWDSWTSDAGGNVTVWGIDTTLPSQFGDSGSPVYQDGVNRVAIGILNNQLGNVTLLDSCFEALGDNCSPYPGGPHGRSAIVEGRFTTDYADDLVSEPVNGNLTLHPHTPAGFGAPSTIGSGWQYYPVLGAGDFTGDGYTDIVARHAAGNLYLYPRTPSGWGTTQLIGTSWQDYEIILATDFTGDGWPDVVAQHENGQLKLFPRTPSGWGTVTTIGTGWQSFRALFAADFTGDWWDDIIAIHNSGNLYLYPHTPAGWGSPSIIGVGWQDFTILIGPDFTGDGYADIVGRHESGSLYLYPHTPSGFGGSSVIGTGW